MIFREYGSRENKTPGFSDLLNYAHMVDDGVILQKDGAFLTTYQYQGPDIHSAGQAELDRLVSLFNRMVTFLGDGWMLHLDEIRIPSMTYPAREVFPHPVAALIDEERRKLYESEGSHYENLQFLTFVWKFPLPMIKTLRHWFVEGEEGEKVHTSDKTQDLTQALNFFHKTVERCIQLISAELLLEKLDTASLLSFLNTCVSGEFLPLPIPPTETFLDVFLSRNPVIGGYVPKIGSKNVLILSIIGYANSETLPGLLEEMSTYPLVYRWSNRFIPFSESTAEREIKRYQKNWNNKVKGLIGVLKEVVWGRPSEKINRDALRMSQETDEALELNNNHQTRWGYWTGTLVLMGEDLERLKEAGKTLSKYLEHRGLSSIQETVNAFDAYLGTIPGHGSCNARRLFLNALNLSQLLPLHSLWTGNPWSGAASLLPPKSPPVFYAATTGRTPFRFHLDVSDVGHQMVLGPTGSGKSTYLDFLIAQFLRYPKAQVYVFDKDYSHCALTFALGGYYYDLGQGETLSLCPLAYLSTESQKIRAEQWIETLLLLQRVDITPDIRIAIHRAIQELSQENQKNNRNLTIFQRMVQHDLTRQALQYYTLEGPMKMLDATQDTLNLGYLQTFEMNGLLSQKPEVYLPVLLYIFGQIESRLEEFESSKDGSEQGEFRQPPTLIILEEAWLYLSHEVFAQKLREWLKTLRKKNARVVFATQSLSDIYDPGTQTLTPLTATMMESCPTKIYLPNPKMECETRSLYQKMGLSDRQLELIEKIGIPKRHYYVVTPEGQRLIELGFQDSSFPSLALAFIGLSREKSSRLMELIKTHRDPSQGNKGNPENQEKEAWVEPWLQECGLSDWILEWRALKEFKELKKARDIQKKQDIGEDEL